MRIVKKEVKLCFSCMKEHEVLTVIEPVKMTYNGIEVHYEEIHDYCEFYDEFTTDEEMFRANDKAFWDVYNKELEKLSKGKGSE